MLNVSCVLCEKPDRHYINNSMKKDKKKRKGNKKEKKKNNEDEENYLSARSLLSVFDDEIIKS